MRTTGPVLARRATEDTELLGRFIPKGTMLSVASASAHRLGDHWINVDEFDPLRHVEPRNEHKAHRFGYVPFEVESERATISKGGDLAFEIGSECLFFSS